MSHVQFSDVQVTNLTQMLTIRDGIRQDRVAACCKFSLDASQAERVNSLSIQQIMAVIANVGDTSLFPPRRDLIALLDAPLPLTRPLAAVHAAEPPMV